MIHSLVVSLGPIAAAAAVIRSPPPYEHGVHERAALAEVPNTQILPRFTDEEKRLHLKLAVCMVQKIYNDEPCISIVPTFFMSKDLDQEKIDKESKCLVEEVLDGCEHQYGPHVTRAFEKTKYGTPDPDAYMQAMSRGTAQYYEGEADEALEKGPQTIFKKLEDFLLVHPEMKISEHPDIKMQLEAHSKHLTWDDKKTEDTLFKAYMWKYVPWIMEDP